MVRSKFLTLISLIVLQVSIASAGQAQDLSLQVLPPAPAEPTAQLMLEDYDGELAAAKRRIRRGGIGVPVSAGAVWGGSAMLVTGGFGRTWCFDEPAPCADRGETALMAVGAVSLLAGAAGLIWSSVTLRKGRKQKRELQRPNRDMELSLKGTGASFRLRF